MSRRIFLVVVWVLLFFLIGASSLFPVETRGIESIQTRGQLRVLITEEDWWPFFHVDSTGQLAGIDIDLAHRIANAMGVEPVFIRRGTFDDLAYALEEGVGDIILSYYSYTPQRHTRMLLSKPYILEVDGLLIHHSVIEGLRSQTQAWSAQTIEKLLNDPTIRIGFFPGMTYESWAHERFSQAHRIPIDPSELLEALSKTQLDAFYMSHHWLSFFLASHSELSLHYQYLQGSHQDAICIGIPKDQHHLLLWIDRFLESQVNIDRILESMHAEIPLPIQHTLDSSTESAIPLAEPWRSLLLAGLVGLSIGVITYRQKKLPAPAEGEKKPHWLFNVWSVVFSMILGLYTGAAYPAIIPFFSPLGDLFFNYLLLTGIPILLLMIILNFFGLMTNMGGLRFFGRFMSIMLITLLIGSAIGILVGVIGQPGVGLSVEERQRIAHAMQNEAGDSAQETDTSPITLFWTIPQSIVPSNIVKAFSDNKSLPILFFGILFSFGLKAQKKESRDALIQGLERLKEIFIYLFKISYYLMPIGLFGLMLGQSGMMTQSAGLFSAFFQLTLSQLMVVLIWTCGSWAFGCRMTRMGPLRYLLMIKKPMIVMFSLLSAFAAFPAALEVCEKNPVFRHENVKGALPLLMLFLTPSIASMFSLTAIFLVQLAGIELALTHYLFILFATVGATLATIGMPVPAFLFAISILVVPFGIPVQQAVFFLLPWVLTGMRLETVSYLLLDFGAAKLFDNS